MRFTYALMQPLLCVLIQPLLYVVQAELERLLTDAGFPAEGVSVRREGRGCAVIRAELPLSDGGDGHGDGV